MIRNSTLSFLLCCCFTSATAQQEIPLYPGAIPNSIPSQEQENRRTDAVVGLLVSTVTRPTLTIHLPPAAKANGTAVIICPGGGYGVLLVNREGNDVAKEFNKQGVTAIVLKYRLPSSQRMKDPSIGPLQDAQQALRVVRQHAKEWKVNPAKVGVMGFSAGGHLAATVGTHFKAPAERPDFMVLVNPVISFTDSIGHTGSRNNLLGRSPSEAQKVLYSNEMQVTANTPPAFLVHAGDDTVVPVENSISFYTALKKHKIPAALHIYEKGEHGFLKDLTFEEWFGRCIYWMKQSGWMGGK